MKQRNGESSRSFALWAVQTVIRAYQSSLSPLMLSGCRYYPTCSRYAYEAVEVHGVLRGLRLAVTRLLRCHPFSRGGFDPVPPANASARKVSMNETSSFETRAPHGKWAARDQRMVHGK